MMNSKVTKNTEQGDVPWTLEDFERNKPKAFNPDEISSFLNYLDRERDKAEVKFDSYKDQVNEQFDYVVLEKLDKNKVSIAQAKAQATQDKRYLDVKEEYRKVKLNHLYWKSLAKNGWSHCDNLKQLAINDIAISKLTK